MCRLDHLVQQYGLPLILVTFTLLALLYDLTVPLFEKPDELKHFAVIQYIQTQHRLPIVREGLYRPWDQEGTQPPLYHILAAVAISWLDLSHFTEPPRNPHYADDRSFVWRERGNNNLYLHPPNENRRLDPIIVAARLARWLSILAGLATITLTYHLAKLVFSADSALKNCQSEITQFTNYLALIAAGLVAFLPQFLHISSAITNDSLSTTLAAAALLLLALIVKDGSSTRRALLLGIVLGLGIITKLSLLYLAPLIGLGLLFDGRLQRAWPRLLAHAALIGGLTLLLSGWWFWRNWHIYGDATALNAHLLYRGGALEPRPSLVQIWQTELVGLELSFWAAFGAGQVLLEPWLYDLLRSIKYLVLIGLAIGLWPILRGSLGLTRHQETLSPQSDHDSPTSLILLLAGWTLIIFVALLRWMQITPASLGRLLFPTLPALSILTVWSLSQFRLWNISGLRHDKLLAVQAILRNRITSPFLLFTLLFSLALVSPFRYIQTAYGQTPLLSEAEIPAEVQRVDLTYAGTLRLIGYYLEKSTIQPGEWLPITLYWQSLQPITQNYSAFVHLLDPAGQALAQSNTYPDQGKWPTAFLEPGQVLPDRHYLFVPPDLESRSPLATQLALGLFEFENPARTAKPARDATGQIVVPTVPGPPLLPDQWPQPHPAQPLDVIFADQIRLIGTDSIHENWEPGAQLPLTLYWETLAPPGRALNLFIHLVEPNSQTQVAGFDGPPAFPTTYWQRGYVLTDSRTLTLPPDLPPGEYQLLIGWYDLESLTRLSTPDGDALGLFMVSVSPKNSP